MSKEMAASVATRLVCAAVAVSGVLSPPTILAEAATMAPPFAEGAAAANDSAYLDGTRAMNEKRWLDAVHSFDRVIAAKRDRTDGALYWKAYALQKLGKDPLALATCFQLRSQFRTSSWNRDCSALSLQTRADAGGSPSGSSVPIEINVQMPPMPPMSPVGAMRLNLRESRDPDTEMKILALNSLLNQEPAKAVPVLRGILAGNQPESVKRHAIFVLAQSSSPEAGAVLNDAVKGRMSPELQAQAIQMMAVFEGKRANDTLAEVYRSTGDAQVKQSVIQAFFITQDAPRMVDLARNEKDLELKRQIVSQLALLHDKAAQDYMMELLK